MTDKKDDQKDQNNLNNPFGRLNPNKKADGKPPKFNAYWIYGIIAIVFLVVQYYVRTSRGPVETTWREVKTTMLASNDIDRIVVVNDKVENIYIKHDRLKNYEPQFEGNFSRPAETGPHFTFNIG